MTGRTEHLERELKLGAPPELELGGLQDTATNVVPLLPPQQLEATYYDTPDLRLFDRNITFRHRMGEQPGDGVWTLKLPNEIRKQGLDRTEISWPGSVATIPTEARRVLRGIVRHSELEPFVGINTTRRRFALRDAYGATWAELDDDTVTVSGGPQDGLRFRQLEVELRSGSGDPATREMMRDVVQRLRGRGASPETESKVAKALGPKVASAPVNGGVPRLDPGATVADVVYATIASSLDRILDHDVPLRMAALEPQAEDVHQTRVATRRLRSDLKTFAQLLDPVWVGHVRADLRWVQRVLGKVRDVDVLADRLELFSTEPAGDDDVGRLLLRDRLTRQRRQGAAELATALEEERYLRLLDRLHVAASHPPLVGPKADDDGHRSEPGDLARKAAPGLVAGSWHALSKKASKAARGRPTDRDLHKVRIKAKQVRYGSEAVRPVMGKAARRTAAMAKDLQTVLGDHHDAVIAEEWLAAEARQSSAVASYTAGLLAGEQRRLQKKLRRRWEAMWLELEASTGWISEA